MIGVFVREERGRFGHRHTQARKACEDADGEQSAVSTSRGAPRGAASPQQLRGGKILPWNLQRENSLPDTLILYFYLQN